MQQHIAAVRQLQRCAGLMITNGIGVHFGPYAEHGGGAAMARQVSALDVRDTLAVQDALPALRVTARIVWGVADPFQKVEYGERFARDLGTTVQRIDGGRHFGPPGRHRRGDLFAGLRGAGRPVNGHAWCRSTGGG